MKKGILGMLVLLLGIGQAMAQERGERAQARMDKLDEKVDLTEEQKVQITELNETFAKEMKAMRKDKSEEMGDAVRTMRKEHRDKIHDVLTEEQKQILKDDRKEMREKHKAARKEVREYNKVNVQPIVLDKRILLEESLSDTEKQSLENARSEIKQIKKDMRSERKGMHDDERAVMDREAMKASRDQIKEIIQTQISPIAEAHSAQLDEIQKDLEPQKEQWERDIKAIKVKHLGEDAEMKRGKKMRKGKAGKASPEQRAEKKEEHWRMRFLMMDPKNPVPPEHKH